MLGCIVYIQMVYAKYRPDKTLSGHGENTAHTAIVLFYPNSDLRNANPRKPALALENTRFTMPNFAVPRRPR